MSESIADLIAEFAPYTTTFATRQSLLVLVSGAASQKLQVPRQCCASSPFASGKRDGAAIGCLTCNAVQSRVAKRHLLRPTSIAVQSATGNPCKSKLFAEPTLPNGRCGFDAFQVIL